MRSSLEEFDSQVKSLTAKGKLSKSIVDSITKLALENASSDAHLVSTLFRYHKKAGPSAKLSSLYLIDAIARDFKSQAKRIDLKGKAKSTDQSSTTPPGSPPPKGEGSGTAASFLAKLEAVLGKIVVDCWEEGLREHRDKVRKVLEIWKKASTFSDATLKRVEGKLVDEREPSQASEGPSRPPSAQGSADQQGAIPASVLALLAKGSAPSSASSTPGATDAAEIQRAIAQAKGLGSAQPLAAPAPSAPSLALDPTQLALLQQLAAGGSLSGLAPPPQPTSDPRRARSPSPAPPQQPSRGFPGSRPYGAPAGQGPAPGHAPPRQDSAYGQPSMGRQDSQPAYRQQSSYGQTDQAQGYGQRQVSAPPPPPPGFRPPPGLQQPGPQSEAASQTGPNQGSFQDYNAGAKRSYDNSHDGPTQPPALRQPPPQPQQAPVKPFDPLTFDATSADSWASYAEMLRLTQGFVPAQDQFVGMVSMWYQQQQQMAMMAQMQAQMQQQQQDAGAVGSEQARGWAQGEQKEEEKVGNGDSENPEDW